MTSNIADASQDELLNLIYHHLKDNGHKKAANVLRKHAPQVETEEVKASLSEIFKKWASSDDGDDVCTPELKSPAKRKSGTKSKITAPSAVSPKKSVKNKKASGLEKKSTKQKKKETVTKPRKRKKSVSPLRAGNDSDSDSSLDVEKWKKMVFELSDADRMKMDVLSILEESPVSSPVKSAKGTTTKKPARAKKEGNPAKTSTANPVMTDASKTPSKKLKDKDSAAVSEHHEVNTPSKKAGNKKNISGIDVVKTPKRTKAKATNSSVQDETDTPEAHHETNGLLETGKIATPLTRTKEVGESDLEANRTSKRVHFKKSNSFSEQVESSSETPSKKAKKKKGQSEASNVETDNSALNVNKVKKAVSKLLETNVTIDATSDLSETPSQKVTNKKLKSVVEPVSEETPSKKIKAKKTEGLSEIDQETTSEKADVSQESVEPNTPSKKDKLKDSKSHSETTEPETPFKKVKNKKPKSVIEPVSEETPSKKVKAKKTGGPSEIDQKTSEKADVSLETVKPDSPSRKAKQKDGKSQSETIAPETPLKIAKAKKVKSTEESGVEEKTSKKLKTATSDADLLQADSTNSFSKKGKIKAAEDVEIQNDVPSEHLTFIETPLKSSKSRAKTVDEEDLGNDETSSHDLKTPSKKRKKKREDACDVPALEEAMPEPKKAKKNKEKKSKESENADALQPPAEEEASVPVEISQKKKKKKKKARDEETEEIVADDPPISLPDEEVVVHKKKKKSSEEKQLSSDKTQGLTGT